VLTVHAEGAQVYECRSGSDGKSNWGFREPIATLLVDGKTVGRHYSGPNWDTAMAAPWSARLPATPRARPRTIFPGSNLRWFPPRQRILAGVTTVQRINTMGGKLEGACDKAGTFKKRALLRRLRVPAQGLSGAEIAHAVHGDRTLQDRDPIPVYKRVRDQGIKFPDGLTYVGSWIEPNFDRCFQLMECDDARCFRNGS